jgi:hypothetical protein
MADDEPFLVDRRSARQFAALCLVLGTIVGIRSLRHAGPGATGWDIAGFYLAILLVVVIGLPGVIWPDRARFWFFLSLALTRPIGHVMSLVLLAIVFYGVVTPLGLVFRLIGRDPLGLRHPRSSGQSFWLPHSTPTDPRAYLRPYQAQSPSRRHPE